MMWKYEANRMIFRDFGSPFEFLLKFVENDQATESMWVEEFRVTGMNESGEFKWLRSSVVKL